jgi:hypothetical protein
VSFLGNAKPGDKWFGYSRTGSIENDGRRFPGGISNERTGVRIPPSLPAYPGWCSFRYAVGQFLALRDIAASLPFEEVLVLIRGDGTFCAEGRPWPKRHISCAISNRKLQVFEARRLQTSATVGFSRHPAHVAPFFKNHKALRDCQRPYGREFRCCRPTRRGDRTVRRHPVCAAP